MVLTSVLQNRLMHLAAGTPSSFEVQLFDMRLQLESQVVWLSGFVDLGELAVILTSISFDLVAWSKDCFNVGRKQLLIKATGVNLIALIYLMMEHPFISTWRIVLVLVMRHVTNALSSLVALVRDLGMKSVFTRLASMLL
jgi:hypothetical protein